MQVAKKASNWKKDTILSYRNELALSKSEKTVIAYCSDVAMFHAYLDERSVKWASTLKPAHVSGFLGQSRLAGKSTSTISRYYMALKSYCRHLSRTVGVHVNFEDIVAPKYTQKTPKVPTMQEVRAILGQPDPLTESGCRDIAMLELLYSSGLRASELCDLELQDFGGDYVTVREGKRDKTRTIPTTESARDAVRYYIDSYRGTEPGYLFVTLQDKQIRRQLLGAIVADYARKAGVDGVTTHSLRHACATHLLNEGADLLLIKEVLGHASIASTQRYTHLSSAKMNEMFHKFHPRKRENV